MTKKKTEEKVEEVAVEAPAVARKVAFDAWASRRGVKEHWKAGMRAFTDVKKTRTLEEWDAIFKNY